MDEAAAPAETPTSAPLPTEERARLIAELSKRPVARYAAPWRGGYLKAPVIVLAEALLAYRLENGRLIAELREQSHSGGADLLASPGGQETLEVQRLLHRLLVTKAGDPQGPILQELERLGTQTEPLLITADGVVVNGNRRLASMRELLARDPARYGAFAEVAAAVLPADATSNDLEAVEAALQMAPETKLAYGWINRRLKLRRQRDELGLPLEAICEASRLAGPPQLDREIAELALAEDYLADYCAQPGRYSLVGDAERLFVGLRERLELLPEELRDLWREAAFMLIHGRAYVKGPLDRHFPFAAPVPDHLPAWAMRRLAEERELVATGPGRDEAAALDPETRQDLLAAFADRSRSPVLAPALFGLTERLRAEFHEEHNPVRMLKLLEKLRQTMGDLAPEQLDDQQRRRLRSQVAAVQAQMGVLLGEAPSPRNRRALAVRLTRLFTGR